MSAQPVKRKHAMPKRKARKPKGFKAFDELTRKLVQVPKGELDQQAAKSKADRKRRRSRKKK